MHNHFFNFFSKSLSSFKMFVEKKEKYRLYNFLNNKISTKIITGDKEKAELGIHKINKFDNILNNLKKDNQINQKTINICNIFNNYINISDINIYKEGNLKKILYFKWKARKSYKKRVLNLPSTKSRRRYAQKNR
ncbi:conserved Plasmodium protein, unknown function [Plasmodium gallinaceum]|uniref:Uncharacterized protein n=1 Tax=Plasmodium gallinaceum TaxID=5849 RepID=A0A1J1GYY6_PLAGA|nr:conserved Plasmodium protein, unknown function [Plasmodium gallinaceum]CRG97449.1 conserved Plasmodium protein, unknown function [Plasmodium gallinaceum]